MPQFVSNSLVFLGWFLVFYLYHGLGITLGYHRLLTHKALKVPKWLMYFIVSGGYLCLMGGPITWVGVHRLHHQKSDMDGDPHSPSKGFFYALVGWMTKMKTMQSNIELQNQCRDLMKDPIMRSLGKTHESTQALACLAICVLFRVALYAFGGPIILVADLLATFIIFWSPQLVNTVCHWRNTGYRTFETKDNSRNVWWVGLVALGEGWHNNHHAIPTSARHGMSWWEIDITWYATLVLEKLGLATDVVRPNKQNPTIEEDQDFDLEEKIERQPVSV